MIHMVFPCFSCIVQPQHQQVQQVHLSYVYIYIYIYIFMYIGYLRFLVLVNPHNKMIIATWKKCAPLFATKGAHVFQPTAGTFCCSAEKRRKSLPWIDYFRRELWRFGWENWEHWMFQTLPWVLQNHGKNGEVWGFLGPEAVVKPWILVGASSQVPGLGGRSNLKVFFHIPSLRASYIWVDGDGSRSLGNWKDFPWRLRADSMRFCRKKLFRWSIWCWQ